jgi:hypothetical protein
VRFKGYDYNRTSDGVGVIVSRHGRTLCGMSHRNGNVVLNDYYAGDGNEEVFAKPDEALARVCEILRFHCIKQPEDPRDPLERDYKNYEPAQARSVRI